jgi:cytochrome c-type biogenesis protein CcmH
MRRLAVILAALMCLAAAADPAERLADPAKEARARTIFRETRCLVCQNESIDDSEADLARDLRGVIRGQIDAGRTDAQVRAFLVARYGEFVMLKPSLSPANWVLWFGPFLVVAAGTGWLVLRRRSQSSPEPLSPEEEARLAALTNDEIL